MSHRWFQELFGFKESDSNAVSENISFLPNGEVYSRANGVTFHAGQFSTPQLRDLRSKMQNLQVDRPNKMAGILRGDARKLHARSDLHGALFQVASQTNCLEMVSQDVSPAAGITGYIYDRTQGPACSLACAAGTLHRNYVANRPEKQIDTLENLKAALPFSWTSQNGYAMFTEEELLSIAAHIESLSEAERDKLRELVCIGLQHNTQVTDLPVDSDSFVSQAFCSALPIGYHCLDVDIDVWQPIAQLVLEGMYEATICAAYVYGCKSVILTRLGGGCFANKDEWIDVAIQRAVDSCAAGLDIYINIF